MDLDVVTRVLAALERETVAYKVVGAVALQAHGLVRATQALDLFVAPDEENVARLRRALKAVFGEDPHVDEIRHEDLSGDYPAIQYVPPDGTFSIDILSRLGEAHSFEDLDAERTTWRGFPVTVASPRQLYEMKRRTVRWKDRIDAEQLRLRFGLEED